ncbi:MAG: aminopeptidase P family protein [Clostridia bacterium]|nr:aminopeptidase P family protein [Clostridia bacterium]
MLNRIETLFDKWSIQDTEGIFVVNESNVTYMSGFTGEAAYLILSKKGNVLMTDGRYEEQGRSECGDHFEVTKWHQQKRPDPATILHYLEKFSIKTLYFNEHALTVYHFQTLKKYFEEHHFEIEMKAFKSPLSEMRSVKSKSEIALLRKACQISDLALEKTVPHIKAGMTELEVVALLEYNLKMEGAENLSFDSIVLSGKKTSLPHGKPSDKILEPGDFLQLDFGALYKGYHADMSRTFVISVASEEQIKLYENMLEATLKGTESLRPNILGSVPDQVVRETIKAEYLEYYYPGLGHGVGLDVHEDPNLSQTSIHTLKANQVVTVEPGVYIPNWGGMRIEDTVLITETGYEVLTHYPRHLQILR